MNTFDETMNATTPITMVDMSDEELRGIISSQNSIEGSKHQIDSSVEEYELRDEEKETKNFLIELTSKIMKSTTIVNPPTSLSPKIIKQLQEDTTSSNPVDVPEQKKKEKIAPLKKITKIDHSSTPKAKNPKPLKFPAPPNVLEIIAQFGFKNASQFCLEANIDDSNGTKALTGKRNFSGAILDAYNKMLAGKFRPSAVAPRRKQSGQKHGKTSKKMTTIVQEGDHVHCETCSCNIDK